MTDEEVLQNEKPQLLQEVYAAEPWKLLVCCILLNCTRRCQVDRIRLELFRRWKTPAQLAEADQSELSTLLRPLGFYNRRAVTLKRFSSCFDSCGWNNGKLPGVGQYARDSWRMFVENDFSGPAPADDKLLGRWRMNNS